MKKISFNAIWNLKKNEYVKKFTVHAKSEIDTGINGVKLLLVSSFSITESGIIILSPRSGTLMRISQQTSAFSINAEPSNYILLYMGVNNNIYIKNNSNSVAIVDVEVFNM